MKKIIGIAAAALMSLSLFACGTTTTKTRVIDDVPYSTTRVVRRTNTNRYTAPRTLTPNTVRSNYRVDAPNLLPYVMNGNANGYGTYNTTNRTYRNNATNNAAVRKAAIGKTVRNSTMNKTTVRNAATPYNVNN